ncbi:MAG: NUDIX domain-containing protein [Rikenellaceae bacterium]
MKINVYYNDKVITNCLSEYKNSKKSVNCLINDNDFPESVEKLMEILENDDILVFEDMSSSELLEKLSKIFKHISAAGGVVKNDEGQILMIYRNSKWDLPKGKQEKGETTSECAEREVEEECGVKVTSVGEKICDSYHIYYMFEKWIIKTTSWYRMSSNSTILTPQTEEGISEIEWVDKNKVLEYLNNSYPTICEVYDNYLQKENL